MRITPLKASLPALLLKARNNNPDIAVARQAWKVAKGQVSAARAWPDPTLTYVDEKFPSGIAGVDPEAVRSAAGRGEAPQAIGRAMADLAKILLERLKSWTYEMAGPDSKARTTSGATRTAVPGASDSRNNCLGCPGFDRSSADRDPSRGLAGPEKAGYRRAMAARVATLEYRADPIHTSRRRSRRLCPGTC